MLRGLDIRDILIIDRLELDFQAGLNVLTGETGAGKSILLDSLGFVLGWRGRAELVRSGADQGEVVAVFELSSDHPARDILQEAGFEVADELILRRVNSKDGRKTAWVNDRRCSGELLRQLSQTLVELHGQHDDRGLLNPRGHMALLDEFGGLSGDLAATRKAWRGVSSARKDLKDAQEILEAARTEEDFLRHAIGELDMLDPQPGEEAKLDATRRRMQAAQKIREDILKANAALGFEGAEAQINDATGWLRGAADEVADLIEPSLVHLAQAQEALGLAQQGVENALNALDFSPEELDEAEERLFAIRAMARKHGVLADDLGDFADKMRAKILTLDQGEANLSALQQNLDTALQRFDKLAQILGKKRRMAAEKLNTAMAAELAPLKMERAIFTAEVSTAPAGPDGCDAVVFTVATNPGAPSGPLNKIASGGELSRFLLALKVCLTAQSTGLTMIFDEIDRGVGGATADAVGRRLEALADGSQVLVVTHSPQVAARGAHHWRVEKNVSNGVTLSTVVPLTDQDRIDEVARMLSGDTITDVAREAAKSLLLN